MGDSKPLSKEEAERRLRDAQEKFEQNLHEFKQKKMVEVPCFRSTFLTSNFKLEFD